MISLEIKNSPSKDWNDNLLLSPTGTIYQTAEYASYLADSLNAKPLFLEFFSSNGTLVGQLMMIRYSNLKKFRKLFKFFFQRNICRWTYGPVIHDPSLAPEIFQKFEKYILSTKSVIMGNDHPLSNYDIQSIGTSLQIERWGTFMIDLSVSKEILWDNLEKSSARKNVERAIKRGVYVKQINNSNLSDYYELLKLTKQKAGIDLSFSDIQNQWNHLSKIGFSGMLAYLDNTPVGGMFFSFFNRYINEWGVARSEQDRLENLYSQDLIKWKIIEWGNEHDCKYFDLSGVNPEPVGKKELGIFRYKKKWGGAFTYFNKFSHPK